MEHKYVLFGAGEKCKEAIGLIGCSNIEFIIDNFSLKIGEKIEGIDIYSPEEVKKRLENYCIIIAAGSPYAEQMEKQLQNMQLYNYKCLPQLKVEITRKKIENRPDNIAVYKKAIQWIHDNTIENEGIICNSNLKKSYPEVTGYYIPTLLRWGYRDLAMQYARWLLSVQKEDGSWYDTENKAPYVFDTAQILKGLLAIREIMPEVDRAIIQGCDWVLSNMQSGGRLTTPDKTAWGNGRICTELIHLYCLSPLVDAGRIFEREDYIEKANLILKYYKENHYTEIIDFSCLSHFYAYVMEALLDMGEEELAIECMKKVSLLQNKEGMVPAYKDVNWVCSTGLFQFALVWFRLGDIEKGNAAFSYACKLQNDSGGWFGSYTIANEKKEVNDYFPYGEISWANKYFLDALYYKNLAEFNLCAPRFLETIDKKDGRYIAIKDIAKETEGKILDIGCGKGRYLKNLSEDIPTACYYGVDLSEKVMEYVDIEGVELKQGNLCNISYPDNWFDLVYTCEALEHAIDVKSAIREMVRVMKPEGKIVIIDKNKECLGCLEIGQWEQWFEVEELKELLDNYCEEVTVISSISYGEKEDCLFAIWVGNGKKIKK